MYKLILSALPRFLAAALFVLFISACDTVSEPPSGGGNPPPPGPQESCSTLNSELELAEASDAELELACLIIRHTEQVRPEMNYHPTLGEIARARAQDMAENGYYGGEEHGYPYPPHVDQYGYGPNHYLCEAGYRPDMYCSDNPFANSVESIGRTGGLAVDSERILNNWVDSPGHRRHILGEVEFFAEATHYGFGYARSEEMTESGLIIPRNFWVAIIAFPPQ